MENATSEYPFIKCLNPYKIRDCQGNILVVSCGHCTACLMRKSYTNKVRCDLESQDSKYTLFVTLTYNNEHVPTFSVIYDSNYSRCVHINNKRLHGFITTNEDDNLYGVAEDGVNYTKLFERAKIDSCSIPFLCKRDLQLFFKRYRKLISYKYGKRTKIRYYACGEYGPTSYRPHYHILLFFDDSRLLESSVEDLSSCWKFGYIDSSLSQGRSSSYVTSYVASTCAIPKILQQKPFAPFSIHSRHLGEAKLYKTRKEVYEMSFEDFINRSVEINGKFQDIRIWRSLTNYYFPKCMGYSDIDSRVKYKLYTADSELCRYFKTTSVSYISKRLFEALLGKYLYNYRSYITDYLVNFEYDSYLSWFMEYLSQKYDHYLTMFVSQVGEIFEYYTYGKRDSRGYVRIKRPVKSARYNAIYEEFRVKVCRSIESIIRTSRHFLEFVCEGDKCSNVPEVRIRKKISMIDEFWKKYDYLLLKDSLQKQQDFFNEYEGDESQYLFYLNLFYNNSGIIYDLIKTADIYKNYSRKCTEKFNRRIKHKKLNDLSKMFLKQNNY